MFIVKKIKSYEFSDLVDYYLTLKPVTFYIHCKKKYWWFNL